MRRYAVSVFSVILLAACGLLPCQAQPNFSGTWKLNAAKSDFGAMPRPEARTDRITHHGPDLKDSVTQNGPRGEVTVEMRYSTDGRETTNNVRGNQIRSTARWEGDALAIAGKMQMNGADVTLSDRWSLSHDGKTLTILRHVNSSTGVTDQTLVLEKQ
jgi:hypothetical protein